MADDIDPEQLMRRLAPMVRNIVTASVHEAIQSTPSLSVVPGVVTQVDGETAFVQMDDGGHAASPTPGVIPCTRLASGVTVGARVLVFFFPTSGGAVAFSVTGV